MVDDWHDRSIVQYKNSCVIPDECHLVMITKEKYHICKFHDPKAWTVVLWCSYVDHLHRFFKKVYSNDDQEWVYQICKCHDP